MPNLPWVIRNSFVSAVALSLALILPSFRLSAQAIAEGFDNVNSLTSSGWAMQNNSNPQGDGWYGGDPSIFASQSGPASSYILAYSGNTIGTGTISNWLFTPVRTLSNGDVVSFYTRKVSPDLYPDRLQLRMSTNGASANIGSTATSVGDFTNLLLEINPTLAQGVYPVSWTQYSVTISGLSAPVSGRFAFRYFVTDGGPSGNNSELIGIDGFVYTPFCPAITVSPASLPQVQAGTSINQTITQTGATGTVVFSISAGSLPPGLSLSTSGVLSGTVNTPGVYNFTVKATSSGINGCSGTRSYTLVVCPSITLNPATLAVSNIGTAYSQTLSQSGTTGAVTYSLTSGTLPAGLTLSGNLISGTPTQTGSFPLTIQITDANGCTGSRSYVLNVGCVTSLPPFTPACSNSGIITLTGGTPAGGVYSGTGVSGGTFNPAAGTQVITYTYTSPSGCTSSSSRTLVVNTAPTVSFVLPTDSVCLSGGQVTLSGGSPAGGIYSGNGVSNGIFTPTASGVFPITYTITANNCPASQVQNLTVSNCNSASDAFSHRSEIWCYPNPSAGSITIEFEATEEGLFTGRVITLHGKPVLNLFKEHVAGEFKRDFNISRLPSGVYLLEVSTDGNQKAISKLVIQ